MDRASEVRAKLDLVRGWLDAHHRQAVLFTSQANFAWITAGGRSHISLGEAVGVASVLVAPDEAYLLTTNIELGRLIDEETEGLPLTGIDWPWHESAHGQGVVAELCDPGRSVSDLGIYGMPAAEPDLSELRFTLLPPEVQRYRDLGRDAAEAVEEACRATSPGDPEFDVAGRVAMESHRRDILPLVDLVAADDRIARYRHPLPTRNRVKRTLLVALTGRRHGLHASLTRMVSFGPPDDELAARHAAVSRVDARVILESLPGSSLADILRTGLQQYATEGFPDQWRLHHQGGLAGYAGREVFATPSAQHRLRAYQAVAWNPSITRVKSEDTVLVTDDGPEVLTRTNSWPRQPVELPVGAVDRPSLAIFL
ncbi:MAG TPA: M24 family metallopeptidase [Actinomycetota bacterium]|nr:M24 family metallopeptidase [Actinomycetota bacterium]